MEGEGDGESEGREEGRGRGEHKVKAADVIERVHTELDTGEKDFFSLFFFNNQKGASQ